MSVKQKVLTRPFPPLGDLLSSPAAKRAILQAAYFLAGLAASHGVVFGKCAPFGVAAAAAAPYGNLWAASLGVVLGYLLPSAAQSPVRYLAASLAAVAIRWTLNDLIRVRSHPAFAPLVAFGPILSTGIALTSVSGAPAGGAAMVLAESLLSAGSAFFFAKTSSLLMSGRGLRSLKNQDLACASLTCGVLVLALSDAAVGGVSLGRVLAVAAILLAARCGGAAGGSISGIAAGVLLSLETAGLSYLSGAYALGGMMAGLFAPAGRLVSAAAFVLANGIASLQVGSGTAVLSGLYEVMAGTVLYLLWPKKSAERLNAMFARPADSLRSDALRRSVIMKLNFASKALSGVSESVEAVSKKLRELSAPDLNGVYRKAMDETCSRCGLKIYCWERNYGSSMDAFNHLSYPLRMRGRVERGDFPEQFAAHCSRLDSLLEGINRHFTEFAARETAERRVAQVRGVVAEQFVTTAELLDNMAQELEMYEQFDFKAAQQVSEMLRELGIIPMDVSCRVDKLGRMSLEIEAAQADQARLSRDILGRRLSKALGKTLEQPCISFSQGKCRIQTTERPVYRILSGLAQHICRNGQLSGDSYECFPDGSGRQIAIISDGMGTGGRAAVDGAMAAGILASLLKAGIGFDCALKIVNSALLAKSGDESLSTVDLAALDLFSGKTELMKAGASVTLARKAGTAVRIDAPGLPVGILSEVGFCRESVELARGDLLVMMSDGAVASGDEWLIPLLEDWKGEVPQELAEKIVAQAISRRNDGHDDDITVLVLRLEKYPEDPD